MRVPLSLAGLAVLNALLLPRTLAGAAAAPSEYEVKAAFLYNFARYVEWPVDAEAARPFVITIVGHDPFGPLLERVLEGKSVGGRPIRLHRAGRNEQLGACDLLFVSDSEAARLPALLHEIEGAAVLTVGEMERFAERGGVIRFRNDRGRIRLDINVSAAERSRLRISSELLKLARIVGRPVGG